MFRAFNIMIITLIEGITNFCRAFAHISSWAEGTSAAFADEAANDRKVKLINQAKELAALTAP